MNRIGLPLFTLLFMLCIPLGAQQVLRDAIFYYLGQEMVGFPQEKMSIHTDRPSYLAGERIWFRTHLVDALQMKQANASRYVYVELIDPAAQLVKRIKLRPDSLGYFHGYFDVQEELPEGYYTLRAYTQFMRNVGTDYFAHKQVLISTPATQDLTPHVRLIEQGSSVATVIHFSSVGYADTLVPQEATIFPKGTLEEDGIRLKFRDGVAKFTFRKWEVNEQRTFLLQTVYNNKVASRFLSLPTDTTRFAVSFFPEGGSAIVGCNQRIAFKALAADGLSIEVKGEVVDDLGQKCALLQSVHLGMGSFVLNYQAGRKYYAHCLAKNGAKQTFELPQPKEDAVGLAARWTGDFLRLSLLQPAAESRQRPLTLVAQLRGLVLYANPWDYNQPKITFERSFFPAGITHLMLIDDKKNIVSERLVFNMRADVKADLTAATDKPAYEPRQKVNLALTLKDALGHPLKGNFSLSVVDGHDVKPDSTQNILSDLLLTSDLRGYIEQPLSYFQGNKLQSHQLDLLMMTQGWRRYNIPEVVKGNVTEKLSYPLETSDVVKGRVEGFLKGLKDANLTLLAIRDSLLGTHVAIPDKDGYFSFDQMEYPERTKYIIQALKSKRGSAGVFLTLDSVISPAQPQLKLLQPRTPLLAERNYVMKMDQKYTLENGMRVYNLGEILVTARRKSNTAGDSPYYSANVSRVTSRKDIEKGNFSSVLDMVRLLPGVAVIGSEVTYRGQPTLVILDNMPEENFDYERLIPDDVGDLFFAPPTTVGPVFGGRGANGAIVINTRRGFVEKNTVNNNMAIVRPIGYQQSVEFYSPVYDTPEKLKSTKPDLRSTIYWNPAVTTDEHGEAHISFYTADSSSRYRLAVEGVSAIGAIICSEQDLF